MAFSEQQNHGEFESDHSDEYDSDDSRTDPTFDVIEGTRSKFSRLSIQKKSKPRLEEELIENVEGEGDPDIRQVVVPVLDVKDQKFHETVEEAIKAGQLEKLKVEQCKVYLRKHGLRLTGNKDTLIQRIREHIDILNGGGERKYPASSFLVNCKGDACTGDVVLFEQNVYEIFNIASRSANGPPYGTRLVAGRIVKESYGAAKQQHTFTIEVLWSKGEKPLPPLHQLLIKGRNLYRIKTMRQEWEDETERKKMLSEKHARGYVARSNREIRVQEREIRKMRKLDRILKAEDKQKQMRSSLDITLKNMEQPQQLPEEMLNNLHPQNFKPNNCGELRSCNFKTSARPEGPVSGQIKHTFSLDANVPLERHHHGRQPFTSMNCNLPRDPPRTAIHEGQIMFKKSVNSVRGASHYERNKNYNSIRSHLKAPGGCDIISSGSNPLGFARRRHVDEVSCAALPMNFHSDNLNLIRPRSPKYIHVQGANFIAPRNPVQGPLREKQQPCRYYAQGRCYYGYTCKWLHEGTRNQKLYDQTSL